MMQLVQDAHFHPAAKTQHLVLHFSRFAGAPPPSRSKTAVKPATTPQASSVGAGASAGAGPITAGVQTVGAGADPTAAGAVPTSAGAHVYISAQSPC